MSSGPVFGRGAAAFYRGLAADNTREYFEAHRDVYERAIRVPLEDLADLAQQTYGPAKVFRPNRDVRFSKDKSPYKTRCYGVAEGERGEGYYVGISAQGLSVGSGAWMMAKDQLARYRAAVDDPRSGAELEALVADVRRKHLRIEDQGLKTAPRGYPRDHPRIELLRAKSLAGVRDFEPAAWLGTPKAADRIVATWRAAGGMNAWLAEHVGPSTEPPSDRW